MKKKAKKKKASKGKAKSKKSRAASKPVNGKVVSLDGVEATVASLSEQEVVRPAPRGGPEFTLRFRSESDKQRVKAAAGKAGLSLNTYIAEVLHRAAEAQAQS